MESPDSTGEEKEQPKQNPDPEIQAIIEQTAEAMSLPIGYIDGLIDEAKFRKAFPCETLFGRDRRD